MSRVGKVARLPVEIRDELNGRLENNEQGPQILDWLNGLDEVQEIVAIDFGGKPITKQNLSEWRRGGFREWQIKQELLLHASGLSDTADEINEHADASLLGDNLVTVLITRYAGILARWDGNADAKFDSKLRALRGLCHDIVQLQRSAHRAVEHKAELQRQSEEEEERRTRREKDRKLAPIEAAAYRNNLENTYGEFENGKWLAAYKTAVEFNLPIPKMNDPKSPAQTGTAANSTMNVQHEA